MPVHPTHSLAVRSPVFTHPHTHTQPPQVLLKRPDLKLVVMSATLEAEKFQDYFLDAPLMKVRGGGDEGVVKARE